MKQLKQRIGLWLRRYPLLMRVLYFFYRRIQAHYTLGVVGVIMDQQGRVLLVNHVFHPEIPWGLPGGWVDRHEAPDHAVRREIAEELGLHVEVGQMVMLNRQFDNHLDLAFVCHVTGDPEPRHLSFELTAYAWFQPDDLPRLHKFHYDTIQLHCETIAEVQHDTHQGA